MMMIRLRIDSDSLFCKLIQIKAIHRMYMLIAEFKPDRRPWIVTIFTIWKADHYRNSAKIVTIFQLKNEF